MRDVLFKIINQFTKGVDTYHNNGSMWFIFTDEKKWVIELTKEGTLWYNFYFFQDCFKYLSLDVVENQHYITEWVEDTIQNGVRYTTQYGCDDTTFVESVIQNGIKEVKNCSVSNDENAKNAIEFGIKETHEDAYHNKGRVEGVIRNGIIETRHGIHFFEDTTENVIKNGVKETKSPGADGDLLSTIEWMESNNAESVPEMIDNVIENGIKEVKELPDQSGELNGYGEYYARQKNMTYPHTDIVNDVITDGIKETNWRKVDNHPTYLDHILI